MLGSIDPKYRIAALASGKRHLVSYVVEKKTDMQRIQEILSKQQDIQNVDIMCIETIV